MHLDVYPSIPFVCVLVQSGWRHDRPSALITQLNHLAFIIFQSRIVSHALRCSSQVKYEDAGLNLDFFGRKKEVVQAPMTLSQATAHTASRIPKVYFKFQEGFSNAVKKPLRLRDLL